MIRYIIHRILFAVPTIFAVITVSFFLMRLAPGGPFDIARALPPAIEANVLAAYDLDQTLLSQFGDYLYKLVQGDFGPSYRIRDFDVRELIMSGLPVSLQLGGIAILVAFIVGVTLGSVAALSQHQFIDRVVMSISITGLAVPNFVIAPMLTLIFGVYFSLLPVGGWAGGAWSHKILPIISLSLPQIAFISRLTRSSLIDTLNTNFIRTARAKGLGERIVVLRHCRKAVLLPVITYLGPATAAIATGSVVIETIFDIPGIGRYFVNGALNRDYTLVMGVVIVYSCIILLLNLIVDILYTWLDPTVTIDP